MNRPSLILLLAAMACIAIGFSSCRDADGSDASPTPTPAPDVTPTPTPSDNSSGDSSATPTPVPVTGSTATPTPTPGSSSNDGAEMTSAAEIVRVVTFKTGIAGNAGDSTIEVARANGEVWRFGLTVTPNTSVGENVTFRDTDMIFGNLAGNLVFRDGSSYGISSATRIQ